MSSLIRYFILPVVAVSIGYTLKIMATKKGPEVADDVEYKSVLRKATRTPASSFKKITPAPRIAEKPLQNYEYTKPMGDVPYEAPEIEENAPVEQSAPAQEDMMTSYSGGEDFGHDSALPGPQRSPAVAQKAPAKSASGSVIFGGGTGGNGGGGGGGCTPFCIPSVNHPVSFKVNNVKFSNGRLYVYGQNLSGVNLKIKHPVFGETKLINISRTAQEVVAIAATPMKVFLREASKIIVSDASAQTEIPIDVEVKLTDIETPATVEEGYVIKWKSGAWTVAPDDAPPSVTTGTGANEVPKFDSNKELSLVNNKIKLDYQSEIRFKENTKQYAVKMDTEKLQVKYSVDDWVSSSSPFEIDNGVVKVNGSPVCTAAGGASCPSGAGVGTVTSVATGAGLAGGPVTGVGTISVATGGIVASMLHQMGATTGQVMKWSGAAWVPSAGPATFATVTPPVCLDNQKLQYDIILGLICVDVYPTTVGNVGVGVAAPSEKFHVKTTTANTNLMLESTSSSFVRHTRTGVGNWIAGVDNGATYRIANNYQFDGNNYFFNITNTGNVGIGVSAPTAKLQVENDATITYPTPGTTKSTVHLNPTSAVNGNTVGITFGANDMASVVRDSAQAGIYVQSSGAYGTKMYFGTTDNYATGSKSRMMIDHLGNVEIGTSTPANTGKLVVLGGQANKAQIYTQAAYSTYTGDGFDANGIRAFTVGTPNGADWLDVAYYSSGSGEYPVAMRFYSPDGVLNRGNSTPFIFRNQGATTKLALYNSGGALFGDMVAMNPSSASSSGTAYGLKIQPTLTQSGTAGYTGLLVNATETSTGSGAKKLLDLQVGGVSKFSVDNTGAVTSTVATTGTSASYTSTSGPQMTVGYDGTNKTTMSIGANGVTTFAAAGTSPSYAFTGGNVMIGTGTPAEILSINAGTVGTSRNIIKFQAGGWGVPTATNAASSDGTKLDLFSNLTNNANQIGMDGSGNMWFRTGGSQQSGFSWYTASDNTSTPTAKMTLLNGGSLGIGTASPTSKLHVAGDLDVNGMKMTTVAGGGPSYTFTMQPSDVNSVNDNFLFKVGNAGGAYGSFGIINNTIFKMRVGLGPLDPDTYFDIDGKFGIGTPTPLQKLHVKSASAQDGIRIDATTYPEIRFDKASSTHGYIGISGAAGGYSTGTLANSMVLRSESSAIHLATLNTISLTALNGSVGIGSTSPGAKLHVTDATNAQTTPVSLLEDTAGSPGARNILKMSRLNNMSAGNFTTTNAALRIIDHSAHFPLSVEDHSANVLFAVKGDGKAGVGVSSPTANLDVKGVSNTSSQISLQLRSGNSSANYSSNQIAFGYDNADTYRHVIKTRHDASSQAGNSYDFYTWNHGTDVSTTIGTKHVMSLNGNGNVGIGITTPGAPLHIKDTTNLNSIWVSTSDWALNASGSLLRMGHGATSGNTYAVIDNLNSGALATGHLILQSGGGNVGIGTVSPDVNLHVVNDIHVGGQNNAVANKVAISGAGGSIKHTYGYNDGRTDGNHGRFELSSNASYVFDSGTDSGGLVLRENGGTWSAVTGGPDLRFLTGGTSPSNQGYTAHSASLAMIIKSSGSVGIGTNAPTEKLEVNGNVLATSHITPSDIRLKTNVKETKGLDIINKIRGVTYDWKKGGDKDVGVIAQEVEKVLPEAVLTNKVSGMKSVKYGNLIAPVIQAIKELYVKFTALVAQVAGLDKKVEVQTREIASLKQENAELKNRLSKIESMLLKNEPVVKEKAKVKDKK